MNYLELMQANNYIIIFQFSDHLKLIPNSICFPNNFPKNRNGQKTSTLRRIYGFYDTKYSSAATRNCHDRRMRRWCLQRKLSSTILIQITKIRRFINNRCIDVEKNPLSSSEHSNHQHRRNYAKCDATKNRFFRSQIVEVIDVVLLMLVIIIIIMLLYIYIFKTFNHFLYIFSLLSIYVSSMLHSNKRKM